jgi:hypothetical protein
MFITDIFSAGKKILSLLGLINANALIKSDDLLERERQAGVYIIIM